jgi:hypothetical protein
LRSELAPCQKFRWSVSDQLLAPDHPQYHLKTVFACPLLFRDKKNPQVGLSRSDLSGKQTMHHRWSLSVNSAEEREVERKQQEWGLQEGGTEG